MPPENYGVDVIEGYDATGKYVILGTVPWPKDRWQEEIERVEALVSPRTLREAALGNEGAVARIKEVEENLARLRSYKDAAPV